MASGGRSMLLVLSGVFFTYTVGGENACGVAEEVAPSEAVAEDERA